MLGYHVRQLGNGLGDLSTIVGTVDYDPGRPGGYVIGEPLNSPANNAAAQRQFDLKVASAKKLPACTGQDCTLEEWRAPNVTSWWMPPGSVRLAWGLWATVLDFKDFNASSGMWSKVYKASELPDAVNGSLLMGLRWASGEEFKKQVKNWPSHPRDSVNHFIAAHPEFAYEYNGYRSAKYPTPEELGNTNGMYSYMARGGVLLSKKVIDGQLPMRTGIMLESCLAWCRGCVSSSFPDGAMTCAEEVQLDPESRHWDLYITYGPYGGKYTATLKRQPDRMNPVKRALTTFFNATHGWLEEKICGGIDKPETQAVAATAATAYPAAAPVIVAVGAGIKLSCAGYKPGVSGKPVIEQPSATVPTPVQPSQDLQPWFKSTSGMVGLTVAGGLAGGLLLFAIVRSRR